MAVADSIKEALASLLTSYGIQTTVADIALTIPPKKEHGDYSTNAAMRFAKKNGFAPLDLAKKIVGDIKVEGVEKVEAVAPGFINFFVSQEDMFGVIGEIFDKGSEYGQGEDKKESIDIEYVSANPTGYLHLGHARGAAVGDSLARILKKAGYHVTREYYINDAGNQIDHMGDSLIARYLQALGHSEAMVPEDGYHGQDIIDIATQLVNDVGSKYENDANEHKDFFKQYGTEKLLDKIKADLKRFGVEFDVFTSEKAIRASGKVQEVLEKLAPMTYVQDGGTFLKTVQDGDDKDRCIIKSDGSYTYFLPDIAYHADKFSRGFNLLIDVFGADHAGYVARLKSAMKSLGNDPDKLKVSLVQIVRLFKGGQEYRMSKRTGNAVAMNDLIDEVGVDAVRYFFVSRAGESHLDFDLDLAESLSSSNPVYYAQYTHARLNSLLQKGAEYEDGNYDTALLIQDSEKAVIKLLREYPSRVQEAAKTCEPYKICLYVQNLSTIINEWYQNARVVNPNDVNLTKARLALAKAAMIVLKEALNLIGVSAPEHM